MSLITINKQADPNVSNEIDASKLHQFFRSGYTFKKDSQVSLVNLSVKNDLRNFDIIKGQNDTFVWRIGGSATYMQKEVVLSSGSYNGSALATEIQTKLNASVILGVYKDQFTCTYDGIANQFTIEYNQNLTGDNTNTFQVYKIEEGEPDRSLVIDDTTDPTNVSFTFGDNEYDNDSLEKQGKEYIITGDKGIFGNGGNSSLISRPVEGYVKSETLTTLKSGPISDSQGAILPNITFIDATTTALTNGWDLQDATKSYFIEISDEGTLRIGFDEDYEPDEDDITFFYTSTANYFERFTDNDRTTAPIDFLEFTGTGSLTLTLGKLGYSSCSIGFVRDYLYKGRDNYDVGDYEIRESYGGHDVIFSMDDNGTEPVFDLSRMLQTNVKFPNRGWRTEDITARNITPSDFNNLPDNPAVWGSFTYNTDHIKMSIEIDSNQKIIVKVSHDDAGDGVFTEEITFRQSGNNDGFNSLIKEIQYPLRPVLCLGTGSRYKGAVYNCTGLYDLTEIHNPHHLFKNDNHIENEILTHPVNEMGISLGAPLTLAFFVKFDKLDDSDKTSIPANSFDPNTANISQLIGMDRFVNFVNGSETNQAISTRTPNNIITLPTMYLSLPQFNGIRSINYSGDNSKDIAVIQGSDFKIDEQSGIYNYSPNTLLYTSLGLSNDTILYDIQAELRYASGNLVKNLQLPTTITIHVKQ